jgi:hypothetical protein
MRYQQMGDGTLIKPVITTSGGGQIRIEFLRRDSRGRRLPRLTKRMFDSHNVFPHLSGFTTNELVDMIEMCGLIPRSVPDGFVAKFHTFLGSDCYMVKMVNSYLDATRKNCLVPSECSAFSN